MATLRGRVFDRETGGTLEARVQVLDATGQFRAPDGAVLKRGPGEPFFYCEGAFEVDVPRGQVDVVVERGTEYRPLRVVVDAGAGDVELPLERWARMGERGLYAGNTHVHYDEKETRPLERLRLDPRVEDLPVLVVSRLVRRELAYASNAFPIGRHELSGHGHVIDVGEESRHNYHDDPWRIGLGHIMLINIDRQVDPVSRGILVDDSAPDYPPLVDACDAARGQGGLVLWCHNANGMEAPVAAALGKLDGLNLFDPYWMDPEYDLWYRLLDCGIKLPASTGSDWFVCSSNRVYVDVPGEFSYERWLEGLRDGRTFVTNGPVLGIRVEGRGPSNEVLEVTGDRRVEVVVEWDSAIGIDRVELIRDGEVIHTAPPEEHRERSGYFMTRGDMRTRVDVAEAGWLAARCWGTRRNSYGHPLWAHTSPVYLRERPAAPRARAAAGLFLGRLDEARGWIEGDARFENTGQRGRMLELFAEGRRFYEGLSRG